MCPYRGFSKIWSHSVNVTRFAKSTKSFCPIFQTLKLINETHHHCKIVSAKARRSLNHLHHSLWGVTTTAKSVVYKCLVRPLLEYV